MPLKIGGIVCDHCRVFVDRWDASWSNCRTRKGKKRKLTFCGPKCAFDSLSPLQKAKAIKAWIEEHQDEPKLHAQFAIDPDVARPEMTWEYWLWAEAERQLKE